MANNPRFNEHLDRMKRIHDSKNQDYASEQNPYSNFEASARIANCTVDTVFRVLIGVKLARLDELLKGKTPRNESVEDSLLDLSVYSALWASYRAPNAGSTYYSPGQVVEVGNLPELTLKHDEFRTVAKTHPMPGACGPNSGKEETTKPWR